MVTSAVQSQRFASCHAGDLAQASLWLLVVAGVFFDGQRIDIRPQIYGLAGYRTFDKGHDAAAGDVHEIDPGFGQHSADQCQCFKFIIGKLGCS